MLEILLVDDEPSIRLAVGDALRDAGHRIVVESDGAAALARLGEQFFDVVVSDIRLPGASGLRILEHVRAHCPGTQVILMTAFAAVPDAVAALKDGATDYLVKPFETEELLHALAKIDERRELERALEAARMELATRGPETIVGRSPGMLRLLERTRTIAASDAPVLILGESGTGKELIARSLHDWSPRAKKPFVAVNCAAFPESLIEAELFGHERGAFTGAVKRREGRFKAAHGGTLFLDEIAEIPLPAQAKLLRVLQESRIEPLGTNESIAVDVRIVSATHRNLKERIAQGLFREDLYYRLNVLDIAIPPLRERRSDIPALVEHFLRDRHAEGTRLSPRAWAALTHYPFPGNVRELEHAIEHAVVLAHGREIDLEHLPSDVAGSAAAAAPASTEAAPVRHLASAIKEFEKEYLVRALSASGGKRMRTAELLGISRKNLWEKLRAHGLSNGDAEE